MRKIISFLVVVYPILNIYCLPGFTVLSIANILTIGFFMLSLVKGYKLLFKLPEGFGIFWAYVAVTHLLFASNFGLGLLIPGGVSFFLWVILFWLGNSMLDYNALKRSYRIVFIICSVAFLLQEFSYYTIGSRPLFMLPLPFYGVDAQEILMNQTCLDRSSCFFIEPSHFAQFTLPLLAIEIFDNSNDKVMNKFAIYIVLILLLLQSGNGILGLLILLSIRLLTYLRYSKGKHKYLTLSFFIALLLFAVWKYVGTEAGMGIVERAAKLGIDEDSGSSARTVRGFFLYSQLPLFNKIFGCHLDSLMTFMTSSNVSYLFINEMTGDYNIYLNGFQHVLIYNGIVGMVLFLAIWFRLFKSNNLFQKVLILLYLILMFISNQHLGQMMLLSMLLPFINKNKMKIYNE